MQSSLICCWLRHVVRQPLSCESFWCNHNQKIFELFSWPNMKFKCSMDNPGAAPFNAGSLASWRLLLSDLLCHIKYHFWVGPPTESSFISTQVLRPIQLTIPFCKSHVKLISHVKAFVYEWRCSIWTFVSHSLIDFWCIYSRFSDELHSLLETSFDVLVNPGVPVRSPPRVQYIADLQEP